jgi:NodT family efflux transporter outer membrane factor (OMF) lipoprotein
VKSRIAIAAAALLAAGCAVGPDYKRPEAPAPDNYKEAPPATPPPGGEWKSAEPQDRASRGRWWEVFGDPALDRLEERVAAANQTVLQAEATWRAARAAARVARADLFPTVSAGASATRSEGAARVLGSPQGGANVYELSGAFSWELDLWGRVRRTVEQQVSLAQATAADLENARLSLEAELASDYFALRGTDAEKQLLDTNVAAYETTLKLTRDRHAQGVASGVDVAQAETQWSSTRAQAVDLSLTRAQLEHAIAVLAGEPPSELTIPVSPLPDVVPPAIPAELPSALLERRPDIAAAERRAAAANAGIGVAQAAFYPTLGITASGGYAGSTISRLIELPNRFWSIGASLVETLFSGGKLHAAKAQAVAQYDEAVAGYRETVLEGFRDVEDQLAALRILGDEAAEEAVAVEASERALALARTRYEGGITSYLEVVTAQAAALSNERTAVQLRSRRMEAAVGLVKALGGGWSAAEIPAPHAALEKE